MKARRIFAALGVVSLVTVGALVAAETDATADKKEFKATCPVSGRPAIEDSSLELAKFKQGEGKVYFCCKNCPKAFEKEPAKFELAVRRQLLETGQMAQVGCPFSGRPVNKETLQKVGVTEVGFCCENCQAKFEKAASDEEKLKLVFASLDKGFTRQVMCPVSGKAIKAEHTAEYEGKKVYFCCPNCPKAFAADPKKFLDKLPQFKKPADGEDKAAG
jgi:YHS domain-containing protein